MKVYFIKNVTGFKNVLRTYKKKETERVKFLSGRQIDDGLKKVLDDNAFEFVSFSEKDEGYKKCFIEEYVRLVEAMGARYREFALWWASDIASKNRFVSKLSEKLQKFIGVAELIKAGEDSEIICLGLEKEIVVALKKAFAEENVEFIQMGYGAGEKAEKVFFVIKKFLRILWDAGKVCLRSVLCKIFLSKKDLCGDKEYVLKTFIYDSSFSEDGAYKDVFFGKLVPYLQEKEKLLILANILGKFTHCLRRIKINKKQCIAPIELFISFCDVIKALKNVLFCNLQVNIDCRFFGYDISEILKEATTPFFINIQIVQYLHYASTKNMLEKYDVERFLLTYENNPWERMCIKAVREKNKEITILGFQHTVVPQAALNMFTDENESGWIPDKILTVGEAPKSILEKYGYYADGLISAACALRHEYLFALKKEERIIKRRLLLALEGVKEVRQMVDYVMEQLAGDNKYMVRIRTHPVLPWNYFEKMCKYNISAINNIELSAGTSLIDDMQWSDVVMYWGSTVSIEALKMGKPIIHFNEGSLLSYDPLFEMDFLKRSVSKERSLMDALEGIYSLDEQQFLKEQNLADEYISRYFYPVNEEGLAKFLYKKRN